MLKMIKTYKILDATIDKVILLISVSTTFHQYITVINSAPMLNHLFQ